MVSICDRQMTVVYNFMKHLLLLNHLANLDETWQGCSFGKALPKLFKRLNSTPNSGCHGNQKGKKKKKTAKSLKIFPETNQSVENAGVAFVKGVDGRNNYFEKIKKISNV